MSTNRQVTSAEGDDSSPLVFIDLSHTVEDGTVTYKGLPAPIICDYPSREQSRAQYAEGTEFYIGKVVTRDTGVCRSPPP